MPAAKKTAAKSSAKPKAAGKPRAPAKAAAKPKAKGTVGGPVVAAPAAEVAPAPPPAAWTPVQLSPLSEPAPGPTTMRAPGFARRPSLGLAKVLRVLLAVYVAATALELLLRLLADSGGLALAALDTLLNLAASAAGLALVVVFCLWLHRVLSNARDRHPGADIKPGWAVGSFFIPLLHFVVPYLEVRKGWRADVSPEEGPLLGWFVPWALNVAVGYVTAVLMVMVFVSAFGEAVDDAQAGDDAPEDAFERTMDRYGPAVDVLAVAGLAFSAVAAFFLAGSAIRWSSLQEGAPVS